MSDPGGKNSPAILNAFLKLYLEDQEAGQIRPLAEYQERFPGYEAQSAERYERLQGRGVISRARSADPDSAGSQFFLCLGNADFLDGKYTAFGQLSGGDSTLGDIGDTPVGPSSSGENSKPQERVEVTSIRVA